MNTLYYGDNLQILREHIKDESVDLIYLDPPFNSNANYNVLFKSPTGEKSHAQIEAFDDTWHWHKGDAEYVYGQVLKCGNTQVSEMLRSMRGFLGENDMMAYLTMMAIRLVELHRVLKPSGGLYLHCDPTASHYLKLLLDAAFGTANFRNEIIWKRTSAHSSTRGYGAIHDTLLFYSRSDSFTWIEQSGPYDEQYIEAFFTHTDEQGRKWCRTDLTGPGIRHGDSGEPWKAYNPTAVGRHWQPPSYFYDKYTKLTGNSLAEYPLIERLEKLDAIGLIHWPKKVGGMPRGKRLLEDSPGMPLQDVWTDIKIMHNMSTERLGYPTQKPLALLERILLASSNEGDIVLDPFCGCGTAVHAAEKLKRQWIGMDITSLAIGLIKDRINRAFPEVKFEIIGTPKDLEGAHELAKQDKYQFQWWAVQLIPDAQPYGGKKKGADSGIDGIFYFKPDVKRTEKGIISVKGGENVSVAMVRDLAHVIKREKAEMGLFVTLTEPTKPMVVEAVKEGFYQTEFGSFPRLQIVTIEQLLNGELPKLPPSDLSSVRRAAREDTSKQEGLPF